MRLHGASISAGSCLASERLADRPTHLTPCAHDAPCPCPHRTPGQQPAQGPSALPNFTSQASVASLMSIPEHDAVGHDDMNEAELLFGGSSRDGACQRRARLEAYPDIRVCARGSGPVRRRAVLFPGSPPSPGFPQARHHAVLIPLTLLPHFR